VVIATSGFSDFESAYNIFLQGAHDFLGKPLDLLALEAALGWIVERRAVLKEACGLFGPQARALAPGEADERLGRLNQALDRTVTHFRPLIGHARRLGQLAGLIQPGMDEQAALDVAIAGYLHECGASYQMYVLCQQPRRLDAQELRLVQAHGVIAGGMVARALGRPEFETIIGRQGSWEDLTTARWEQLERPERLACWLGLLNAVDGWLHDRPDRAAVSVAQLREMLQRRLKNTGVEPLERLVDQWAAVETFYQGITRK
jgi:hypothetical protein